MVGKIIAGMLMSLLCVGLYLSPVQAAATSDPTQNTLRVAIPIPAYGEDASSSAYIDYTEEYLEEISKYTGWQCELVTVPGDYESGLQEVMDMLRAGTVDLAAPMVAGDTAAAPGIYYSQSSYLTTTLELKIPNTIYNGETLEDNVRVAMIRESGQQASADAFFARNQITPQYIPCRNVSEQLELVNSGQADVMLNSALEYVPDATVIARFNPQELYFASSDPALMQELDQANMKIVQADIFFAQDLYERYVVQNSQKLTQEEAEFIQQSEPFVVAVLDEYAPYLDINDGTGAFEGIGVDLLRNISETTGLQFQFVGVESLDALWELIADGEVQMVAAMTDGYEVLTEQKLALTKSYVSSPYVLVAPLSFSEPGGEHRLALTKEGVIANGGDQIGSVQQYATKRDCLEAVLQGDADYTYVDLYTAQYYLGDPHYAGLRKETQSYALHEICFGIASPVNPTLLSILNKSINNRSDTETQKIISENVYPDRQFSFRSFIRDYPIQVVLAIVAVALVIAGLLILLLWRKEKHRKVLHKKAMEDGMTQLYNATACRKLITHKLSEIRSNQMGAFLIMDIDDFKRVNDGFGHQEGDRVILEFANLLRDVLRGDNVIARIGGDEFVAFLPSVKEMEKIGSVCARIRERSHMIRVGEYPITVSIGAVVARERDDYDTLYQLSDQALYKAKKQSKDQFCLLARENERQREACGDIP